MNNIEKFIELRCILHPDAKELSSDLYKAYLRYIDEEDIDHKGLTNKKFTQWFTNMKKSSPDHNICSKINIKATTHGTQYVGICVREEYLVKSLGVNATNIMDEYATLILEKLSASDEECTLMREMQYFCYYRNDDGSINLNKSVKSTSIFLDHVRRSMMVTNPQVDSPINKKDLSVETKITNSTSLTIPIISRTSDNLMVPVSLKTSSYQLHRQLISATLLQICYIIKNFPGLIEKISISPKLKEFILLIYDYYSRHCLKKYSLTKPQCFNNAKAT